MIFGRFVVFVVSFLLTVRQRRDHGLRQKRPAARAVRPRAGSGRQADGPAGRQRHLPDGDDPHTEHRRLDAGGRQPHRHLRRDQFDAAAARRGSSRSRRRSPASTCSRPRGPGQEPAAGAAGQPSALPPQGATVTVRELDDRGRARPERIAGGADRHPAVPAATPTAPAVSASLLHRRRDQRSRPDRSAGHAPRSAAAAAARSTRGS